MDKPYRRRYGVIRPPYRVGLSTERPRRLFMRPIYVIDSGDDAPMSPRGRLVFRLALGAVVAGGILLIVVTRIA
jgi:hypothetical protein